MKRFRLVKLVNIIAPYRVPVYDEIGKSMQFTVAYGGNESNRGTWAPPKATDVHFRPKKSWGFTIRIPRKGADGKTVDYRYLQITPGFLIDLLIARPNAILSVEMGFRSLCALAYGTVFRVPVWIWWGGTLHTEREVGGFKKRLRGWFVKRSKRWISYGATSTEYLTSIGVPRNRILQIQNCVDHRRFGPDVEPSVKGLDGAVILHVGQLIGRKGVERLIRAFAAAKRRTEKPATLLMVGDGPDRESLENLCAELGVSSSVRFEGGRKPAALPGIYRSSNVVVFPTLEDVWGLVANEAILSEVPVLASKYAGCSPEIVNSDAIFDPLNDDEFEERMLDAIEGRVPASDASKLIPFEKVAQMITESVFHGRPM